MARNSRQAIIWTNADPIHWRIFAALGGDELINESVYTLYVWGAAILASIEGKI